MIFVFLFAIMVLGECPEPLPNTFALPLARRTIYDKPLCEFIDLNSDGRLDYVCSWWADPDEQTWGPPLAESCFYENAFVQWRLKK